MSNEQMRAALEKLASNTHALSSADAIAYRAYVKAVVRAALAAPETAPEQKPVACNPSYATDIDCGGHECSRCTNCGAYKGQPCRKVATPQQAAPVIPEVYFSVRETVPAQPLIHACGNPMSSNPHPEAGEMRRMLEVGCPWECIPCTVKSRHDWSVRALKAEAALRDFAQQAAPEQATESRKRVEQYLLQRSLSRGLDQEEIHGFHIGSDREAILTVSDIKACLAVPLPQQREDSDAAAKESK